MTDSKNKVYTLKETVDLLEEKLTLGKTQTVFVSSSLFCALKDAGKILRYDKLPQKIQKEIVSNKTSSGEEIMFYLKKDGTAVSVIEDIIFIQEDKSNLYKLDDTGVNAFYIVKK